MNFQAIPIIRIFDEEKAKKFYLGFLSMRLDWEHRFEPDSPIYMQVSRGNLVFHLSEHSAGCTPGSRAFVKTDELDAYTQKSPCEATSTTARKSAPHPGEAGYLRSSMTAVARLAAARSTANLVVGSPVFGR
jgi:hypothetical protein